MSHGIGAEACASAVEELRARRATVAGILERTAELSGLDVDTLKRADRSPSVTLPRFAAMWAANKRAGFNLCHIGRVLGGRDHSTILYGVRRAEQLRRTNPSFRALSEQIAGDAH